MIKLGGLILIKEGLKLDYCFIESIRSMLPVCDSVTVVDGESSDDTQETIRDWMKVEPKIKLCIYKWNNPRAQADFYVDWIQYGREHVKESHLLHCDADELVHESSYPEILEFKKRTKPTDRVSLFMKRWNFWSSAQHVIPYGHCCSDNVVRIAHQSFWLPSDGDHPKGAPCIAAAAQSGIQLFHYGFLRKTSAFFEKARALQDYFFGAYDPRLAAVEGDDNWATNIKDVPWTSQLVKFEGTHPALAIPWLKERGYSI